MSTATEAPHDERSAALEVGDVVTDDDLDRDTRAVVVNTPPVPAHEWYVPGVGTVAEDNPNYPRDDSVAIVVWTSEYRARLDDYSGKWCMSMNALNERNIDYYAFPRERLTTVGNVGAQPISIDQIDPSPYHARTFDASDNEQFIDNIRTHGEPPSSPFIRALPSGRYEVINGHKRLWACHVAGVEEVYCHVHYMNEENAARAWAVRHLDGYPDEERAIAIDRLRETLGATTAESIVADTTGEQS